MSHSTTRAFLALLASATFSASPALAMPYTNLITFGDSLVDQGNTQIAVLAATGGTVDVTPAAAGYFAGRFTNGLNIADYLSVEIEGSATVGSLSGGDNFSFGGARARTEAGDSIPDLPAQVAAYLGAVGGSADPTSLYFINAGGNDIRDILLGTTGGLTPTEVIAEATAAIDTAIRDLQAAGALHFVVGGVGNVGAIPEILPFGAPATTTGTALSASLTSSIFGTIDAGIAKVDVGAIGDAISLDPAAFGLPALIDVTIGCLTPPGAPDPSGAPTCDDFAFFDDVHPTTQLQSIIGDALIAAIPEPGTAGLLVLGLTSLAVRRRS